MPAKCECPNCGNTQLPKFQLMPNKQYTYQGYCPACKHAWAIEYERRRFDGLSGIWIDEYKDFYAGTTGRGGPAEDGTMSKIPNKLICTVTDPPMPDDWLWNKWFSGAETDGEPLRGSEHGVTWWIDEFETATPAQLETVASHPNQSKLPHPPLSVAHATTPPSHSDTENPLDPSNSAN